MASDPFSRHRLEPVQTQPTAEKSSVGTGTIAEPESRRASTDDQPKPTIPVTHTDNPFGRHEVARRTHAESERPPEPPQLLLAWLRDNWGRPVVSLRDIQNRGPYDIRDTRIQVASASRVRAVIETDAFTWGVLDRTAQFGSAFGAEAVDSS
jgi:hypothetical protein